MNAVREYNAELAELERGLSFLNKGGSRAAGLALSALAAWREGAPARASALLEEAAAHTAESWPFLIQAEVARGQGDLKGTCDALGRGLQREPAAATYAARAAARETLGEIPLALADAAEAARLCPCEEHHLLHARLLGGWREYDRAAAACALALELSPGRPDLLVQRARFLSSAGRLEDALTDAENAGDAFLAAQLEVQLGRSTEARRRMAGKEDARARFALAYADLREGEMTSALVHLEEAVRLAPDERSRAKASFYRTLALAGVAEAPTLPGLTLVGLGMDPPFTATLQQLRALRGCGLVLSNVSGEEVFELLRLFCGDCRPLAYHQDSDEERLTETLLEPVRAGRSVAFVTRGHAGVYGPLGRLLMDRCRKAGLPFRCLPSVSSADLLIARYGQDDPGLTEGFRAVDSRAPAATLSRADASTVLTLGSDIVRPGAGGSRFQRTRFGELCASLSRAWGPDHVCRVFPLRVDQPPVVTTVGALAGQADGLEYSAVLYLRGEEGDAAPAASAEGGPGLVLLGLGLSPLEHATVETLQAASACDVLFCEDLDRDVREFLGRFCADVRELASGTEAPVLEALRAGKRAGLVTRHHPFLFTATGRSLVRACGRLGFPWSSPASVSVLGTSLADAGRSLGEDVLVVDCARKAASMLIGAAAALFFWTAGARAASVPEVEVVLSPAVELGFSVERLTSPGKAFAALSGHRAVTLTRELENRGFVRQERIKRLALLGDPPELLDPEPPGSWYLQEAGDAERLKHWLDSLRDFARKADFSAYFAAEQKRLRPGLDALRKRLDAAGFVGAHRRYTGLAYKGRYRLILSPWMETGVSINHMIRRDDGSFTVVSVGGLEQPTLPQTFWHELSHGAFDSLADRYGKQIDRSAALWNKLPRPCYGDWRQCVREHLVRAVKNRLLFLERGEAAAKADLAEEEGNGYLYLGPLCERLKEFEADRKTYPSLVEFYPRWIAVFDELAQARGASR